MKMRSMVSLAGLVVAGFAAVLPAGAADDKALANMKGAVSFSRDGARTSKPVAVHATVTLADKDYAITGADSLAGVTLPDSSRVLVGSDSKVQLGFFNQAAGNNAKFIVFNGKVRFIVQHPAGAKANYTFQTATANVGVRGTEGDVAVQSDGTLTVNVYEVCDSSTPVTVTTKDGARYELNPGQSLVAQMVNGVIRAHVEALTQQLIDQFSPDFGVPHSWDEAKGQIVATAQGQISNAADSATGGLASQVATNLGGLFGKKKSQESPAPAVTPESCSHP